MEQAVESPPEGTRKFGSIADYLQLDESASLKHEYDGGEIVAMAGGTVNHAKIAANLLQDIGSKLRGTSCEIFGSDLRVSVPDRPSFSYPDLSVVCGPVQLDPRDTLSRSVVNSRVLIEILSPSTELYNRGRKLKRYLQLATLEEYVLVSQEEFRIESYFRQPQGTWLFSHASGQQAVLLLRSLQTQIPFTQIYRNATLPPVDQTFIPAPII